MATHIEVTSYFRQNCLTMKIALVGSGLVGGSWALVFARTGFDVTLYDPSQASIQAALDFARHFAAFVGQNQAAIFFVFEVARFVEFLHHAGDGSLPDFQ